MALFITIVFDDEDKGDQFLEKLERNQTLIFSATQYSQNLNPDRVIKTEYVTKED